MSIMDIIAFVIMGISIFFGFKKGFLKTITGFVSIILSLVLATTFHSELTEYLKTTAIYESIYESTYSMVHVPQTSDINASNGAKKLNLPREFADGVQKQVDTAVDSVASKIAETVADAAVSMLSMLLLFIGIRLVLFLITWIAQKIVQLPVIGWGDSLLGALFGLLRGFLLIYLVLAIAFFVVTLSPTGIVSQSIKQSSVAKVMYHNNVLLEFVYKN